MIAISKMSKAFGQEPDRIEIFRNLTLHIDKGTIVSVVGPTGCGKTTLLNIIAGLDAPDSGTVNVEVGHAQAVGYMMQDPLLLPWRSLAQNARLGAEVLRFRIRDLDERINTYFKSFGIADFKNSYPDSSSGGMKQRVALIRTLLLDPELLLLDEPFSNLDFDIKLQIQRHLMKYHITQNATIVLVTHDIEDAISLSDKVLVFSEAPNGVKAEIPIKLELNRRDPVDARRSHGFTDYFAKIWDELKYVRSMNANE